MRSFDFDGQPWLFNVGKSFVELKSPTGEKHLVKAHIMLGVSNYQFEMQRRAGDSRAAITPYIMRRFIRLHIIGNEPIVEITDNLTVPPEQRRQLTKKEKQARKVRPERHFLDSWDYDHKEVVQTDDWGIAPLKDKVLGFVKRTKSGRFKARIARPVGVGDPQGDMLLADIVEPKLFDTAEEALGELKRASSSLGHLFEVPATSDFWLSAVVEANGWKRNPTS